MTSQPIPPVIPAVIPAAEGLTDEELADRRRENVDDDGTPVGEADYEEDIRRSGGDPEEA